MPYIFTYSPHDCFRCQLITTHYSLLILISFIYIYLKHLSSLQLQTNPNILSHRIFTIFLYDKHVLFIFSSYTLYSLISIIATFFRMSLWLCFNNPLNSFYIYFSYSFFYKITCPRCSSRQHIHNFYTHWTLVNSIKYLIPLSSHVFSTGFLCILISSHLCSSHFYYRQISLSFILYFPFSNLLVFYLYLPVLAAAPDILQIPRKSRNPQNFQVSFTKTFEYEIPFFLFKFPKTPGESEYDFFKNPIFPQKPRGIPKHSRFQLPDPLEVRKAREIPFL